jgi:hypothetical protein
MSRDGDRLTRQLHAHLDRSSAEQRGKIVAALWCHSVAAILVDGGLAGCLTLSALRIWRRRDRGWLRATVDGGAWTGVAVLAAASVVRRSVARSVVERMAPRGPETQ